MTFEEAMIGKSWQVSNGAKYVVRACELWKQTRRLFVTVKFGKLDWNVTLDLENEINLDRTDFRSEELKVDIDDLIVRQISLGAAVLEGV